MFSFNNTENVHERRVFSASIGASIEASIGLPLELQTQTTLNIAEFFRLPLGLPLETKTRQ